MPPPDLAKFKSGGLGRAMDQAAVEFVKDIYKILHHRAEGSLPQEHVLHTAATIAASFDGLIQKNRRASGPIDVGRT